MNLHDQIIAALSARQPSPISLPTAVPEEIGHGTLRWARDFDRHHYLLHPREDAVVAWNIRGRAVNSQPPLPPLAPALRKTAARFLASTTADQLAQVTPDRPALFFAKRPFRGRRFDGVALVRPSVAQYRISTLDKTFLPQCTYCAFPCYRCEIADQMDPDWAAFQYAHWGWSDLDREPSPAVRAARHPPTLAKSRRQLRPTRLAFVDSPLSGLGRDWLEIENFARRVLRFGRGAVELLPDGPSWPVRKHADAAAITRAFLFEDRLPEEVRPNKPALDSALRCLLSHLAYPSDVCHPSPTC